MSRSHRKPGYKLPKRRREYRQRVRGRLRAAIVGSSSIRAQFGWPCFHCGTRKDACESYWKHLGSRCCKTCAGKGHA